MFKNLTNVTEVKKHSGQKRPGHVSRTKDPEKTLTENILRQGHSMNKVRDWLLTTKRASAHQ